jgi:hypothetical protein
MNYPNGLFACTRITPYGSYSRTVLVPMEPIDVFMSVFLGMCIGLAGLSFLFS